MTSFYVRLDEDDKTDFQKEQRDMTYDAAKVLRDLGWEVEVGEFFTGSSKEANAAAIYIKQGTRRPE